MGESVATDRGSSSGHAPPRHSGESRNPEVTPDGGSSSGHALHRHSGGSRNPEVTPDRGLSSDRTPLPIPSGDGERIGRATNTTLQEDEIRRNAFVCARRSFSANKIAVEFLEGRVEQPFRRTFHLILPVGAGLFRPRVPLPPLRPRRDVSREGYISRQRLRDPECQGRRLSNDLREGRIPFRGPRRETDLSENFGPGSSACTGGFPPRTCSVDLHSSVVFSVP